LTNADPQHSKNPDKKTGKAGHLKNILAAIFFYASRYYSTVGLKRLAVPQSAADQEKPSPWRPVSRKTKANT